MPSRIKSSFLIENSVKNIKKWRRERGPHSDWLCCKMLSLINKSIDWPLYSMNKLALKEPVTSAEWYHWASIKINSLPIFILGSEVKYLKRICISFLSSRYPQIVDENGTFKECQYKSCYLLFEYTIVELKFFLKICQKIVRNHLWLNKTLPNIW